MSDTLMVKLNGKDTELFMSYGLLTELARAVPNLDTIPALVADNDARDKFLNILLVERDDAGTIISEARTLATTKVSIADIEKLLDWGTDHLTDFFSRRVVKAQEQNKKILTALGQSSSAGMPT